MRGELKTKLEEFIVDPSRLFGGYREDEDEYRGRCGVFHHVEAFVGSAIECGGVEIATSGVWKIYIWVADRRDEPLPKDDLSEGVLQVWMRVNRADFEAADSLLSQKQRLAGLLASYISEMSGRWPIDASALARLLTACATSGERVQFDVPRKVTNATGQWTTQWTIQTTFLDSTIAAKLHDHVANTNARIDLIRFNSPSFGLIAMFISTIRWTGASKVMFRSKPVSDILFGPHKVELLAVAGSGVQFRRVPARRIEVSMSDFARSEFRFEWRLDMSAPSWTPVLQPDA